MLNAIYDDSRGVLQQREGRTQLDREGRIRDLGTVSDPDLMVSANGHGSTIATDQSSPVTMNEDVCKEQLGGTWDAIPVLDQNGNDYNPTLYDQWVTNCTEHSVGTAAE